MMRHAGYLLAHQPVTDPMDWWAKLVYSMSLFCVYVASTLSHSFHTFRVVYVVWRVIDHCSIYVLIAGTYTPLALITLGHTATGIGLCVAQWVRPPPLGRSRSEVEKH
jgi:hemolysin III